MGVRIIVFLAMVFLLSGCDLGGQTTMNTTVPGEETTTSVKTYEVTAEMRFEEDGVYIVSFQAGRAAHLTDLLVDDMAGYFEENDIPGNAYSFDGFYLNEDFTDPLDMDEALTEDMHLYVKWVPNTFTLTYIDDEEAIIKEEDVVYNTALSDYMDAIITGDTYEYYDWDFHATDSLYDRMPAEDLTLIGEKREKMYAVIYEDHQGEVIRTDTYYPGEAIDAPTPDAPLIEGQIFINWIADGDFSVMPSHDVIYVPVYAKKGHVYDVSDLDEDIFWLRFLDLGDMLLVEDLFMGDPFLLDKTFSEKTPLVTGGFGDLELGTAKFIDDYVVFHATDLEYDDYYQAYYYNYLVFYDTVNKEFFRTIPLGNSAMLFIASSFDSEFPYIIDDKIYTFIVGNDGSNPRVEVYDLYDDTYHETISLDVLNIPMDFLPASITMDDDLNVTIIANDDDVPESKTIPDQDYIVYGNLTDPDGFTTIGIEEPSIYDFEFWQMVYDNLLVVGYVDDDQKFIGFNVYDMDTGLLTRTIEPTFGRMFSRDDVTFDMIGHHLICVAGDDVFVYDLLDQDHTMELNRVFHHAIDDETIYTYENQQIRKWDLKTFEPSSGNIDRYASSSVDIAGDVPSDLGIFKYVEHVVVHGDDLLVFSVMEDDTNKTNIIQVYDKTTLALKTIVFPGLFDEEIPDDLLSNDDATIVGGLLIFPVEGDYSDEFWAVYPLQD